MKGLNSMILRTQQVEIIHSYLEKEMQASVAVNNIPQVNYLNTKYEQQRIRQKLSISFCKLFSSCRTMKEFMQIHAQTLKFGLGNDISITIEMINFCVTSDFRDLNYAQVLFDNFELPDSLIYNTMIRGYAKSESPVNALKLFDEMLNTPTLAPDKYTFPFVLKACARLNAIDEGKQVHCHILKMGIVHDIIVLNALINMYAKCGLLLFARQAFDKSTQRDSVSWNSLLGGYLKYGQLEEAEKLFWMMPCLRTAHSWNIMITGYARYGNQQMIRSFLSKISMEIVNNSTISSTCLISLYSQSGDMVNARRIFDNAMDKDVICWSSMISGYCQNGFYMEALNLFNHLLRIDNRITPDNIMLISVVSACAQLGALDHGRWVHTYIQKNMSFSASSFRELACSLIHMYSKCGSIKEALQVFNGMQEKCIVAWNSIIYGLGINGYGCEAMDYFSTMLKNGVKPDRITFISILTACSHAGLLNEGNMYFKFMSSSYDIKPDIKHYGCMVDLLGRAGLLDEAEKMIQNMPFKPNAEIWGTLLGACTKHGNVFMAERAAKFLIDLDPCHSSCHVLLSNVYALTGQWTEARNTRKKIKDYEIKRVPGSSLIELNGKIYEFIVGDVSHPQSIDIYSMSEEIEQKLKFHNDTPDTSFLMFDIDDDKEASPITVKS